MNKTVTPNEAVQAMSSGSNAFSARVTSTTNTIAVRGAPNVPASTAPMLISAQKPEPPTGIKCASRAPSAPPIMRSGASTPEVPEPSENDQITALTITRPISTVPTSRPVTSR